MRLKTTKTDKKMLNGLLENMYAFIYRVILVYDLNETNPLNFLLKLVLICTVKHKLNIHWTLYIFKLDISWTQGEMLWYMINIWTPLGHGIGSQSVLWTNLMAMIEQCTLGDITDTNLIALLKFSWSSNSFITTCWNQT